MRKGGSPSFYRDSDFLPPSEPLPGLSFPFLSPALAAAGCVPLRRRPHLSERVSSVVRESHGRPRLAGVQEALQSAPVSSGCWKGPSRRQGRGGRQAAFTHGNTLIFLWVVSNGTLPLTHHLPCLHKGALSPWAPAFPCGWGGLGSTPLTRKADHLRGQLWVCVRWGWATGVWEDLSR